MHLRLYIRKADNCWCNANFNHKLLFTVVVYYLTVFCLFWQPRCWCFVSRTSRSTDARDGILQWMHANLFVSIQCFERNLSDSFFLSSKKQPRQTKKKRNTTERRADTAFIINNFFVVTILDKTISCFPCFTGSLLPGLFFINIWLLSFVFCWMEF